MYRIIYRIVDDVLSHADRMSDCRKKIFGNTCTLLRIVS